MIEFRNVYKTFGTKELFHDFSLTIMSGEFCVVHGQSGCGKSTLLNIIGGLEKPDKGEIWIDGRMIHSEKDRDWLFGKKIGFLFQSFALVDTKTVIKNLNLIYRRCRSEITAENALERVGLLDKANTMVYQLSGGEQQRVAIARLMVKKCDIVLADEPTASLDASNASNIVKWLDELHRDGKTIVMATHDSKFFNYGTKEIAL